MKRKWVGAIAAGIIALSTFPAIPTSAKMTVIKAVPKSYHGTWYGANKKDKRDLIYISNKYVITGTYSNFNSKTNKIKFNYDTGYLPKNTGSAKLVFKKISKGDGQAGTTYTFNQGDDFDDQLPTFWQSKMKINGKQQTVLKAYTNFGHVNVYTKKPIQKDYSYNIKSANIGSQIGK